MRVARPANPRCADRRARSGKNMRRPCRSRVGIDGSLELLLAERARGDDPEPPIHALEVEHVRARQLPHLLLLPVLRQADAALLQLRRFRNKLIVRLQAGNKELLCAS